jgi:hypothetical protein
MGRQEDLNRFYALLHELQQKTGGPRYLADEACKAGLPERGVYFFFEPGEFRADGMTPKVVRVGTHAVSEGSRTTLWQRLSTHRGRVRGHHIGGGHHRASIFRRHVGTAVLERDSAEAALRLSWMAESNPKDAVLREAEHQVELLVSQYIRAMPFLWLEVGDPPGKFSGRKVIEAGAIGLLSNLGRPPLDPPSPGWPGQWALHPSVRGSGLWNVDHTAGGYDPAFLDRLEQYI